MIGPAATGLLWLAALALLSMSSGGDAADFRPAVDRYLRAEMQRQHIPGIALAVLKDGKPLYVKGYGAATLEHPILVAPNTVFQLGSLGKQFTAVAVMLLADEGKLNLDDPLPKYLPEVPDEVMWARSYSLLHSMANESEPSVIAFCVSNIRCTSG